MHPNAYARRPCRGEWSSRPACCATTSCGQPDPKQPAAVPVQVDAKTGAVIVPLGGLVSFDPKSKDVLTDIVV